MAKKKRKRIVPRFCIDCEKPMAVLNDNDRCYDCQNKHAQRSLLRNCSKTLRLRVNQALERK